MPANERKIAASAYESGLLDEINCRLLEEMQNDARLSMAELIRLRIQTPTRSQVKRKAIEDPLLKVAGICGSAVLSANIDDELYGEGS